MSDCIIGIDPGQTGAIAIFNGGKLAELHDMPIVTRAKGKGLQVNGYELANILHAGGRGVVKIENVHAMPGQGVSSMFKFGEAFGIVIGVVQSAGLPIEWVTPSVWKRKAGLQGKGKDVARTLAIQRHPEWADGLKLKKHVGRADAILIAEFG